MPTKTEIVQEFYDQVWVAGHLEEAGRYFDLSAKAEGLLSDLSVEPAEFSEFVAALLDMLDVKRVTFLQTVEQGDWLSVLANFEATVLATGQTISSSGMLMVRIVDDRIVEAYNCIDFMSLFEKVGLVPESATALCMTGQRLT